MKIAVITILILLSLTHCGSPIPAGSKTNIPEPVPFIPEEILSEIHPTMLEEMQLDLSEVSKHHIKSITVKITDPESNRETVNYIRFNKNGTVSEFKEHKNHKKIEYHFDGYQKLKSLKIIDLNNSISSITPTKISLTYKNATILTQVVGEDLVTELVYTNDAYSNLLTKSVRMNGTNWSKTINKYLSNRLIVSDFLRQDAFYHQKMFLYNESGLLQKETYKSWDEFRDSTFYYYNEDGTLRLSKEGHFRTSQDTELLEDWEDLTLFGKMNKWCSKFSITKTGKIIERIERVFNQKNLLITETRYDHRRTKVKKSKLTYTYVFYAN